MPWRYFAPVLGFWRELAAKVCSRWAPSPPSMYIYVYSNFEETLTHFNHIRIILICYIYIIIIFLFLLIFPNVLESKKKVEKKWCGGGRGCKVFSKLYITKVKYKKFWGIPHSFILYPTPPTLFYTISSWPVAGYFLYLIIYRLYIYIYI